MGLFDKIREVVSGNSNSSSNNNYQEINYTPPKTEEKLKATQEKRQADAKSKLDYAADVAFYQLYGDPNEEE
jgi:hypothetical protein